MQQSFERGSYTLSTDKQQLDLDVIHTYLTQSYWSPGIPRAVVERAIANSLCFGLYHQGQQIGFARMISDFATFAYFVSMVGLFL